MTDDEEVKGSAADTISLMEESVSVGTQSVQTGKVRVRTITEDFEEVVRAALRSESFEITHVTVDREVDVAPLIRTEGDVTIIPVLEEVLFVEKRLILREEIHMRRLSETDEVETPVTLRRQRAVVEHEAAADAKTASKTKSYPKKVK